MTAPIEDVSSPPGRTVADQEEVPIGQVKEIDAIGRDGEPMWVGVEVSAGTDTRTAFIPLARLKEEDGELRLPYSEEHISQTPEVDGREGVSPECNRRLRDHFGVDRAFRLQAPHSDKRTDETKERLQDPGSAEIRHVDAGAIADENAEKGGGG